MRCHCPLISCAYHHPLPPSLCTAAVRTARARPLTCLSGGTARWLKDTSFGFKRRCLQRWVACGFDSCHSLLTGLLHCQQTNAPEDRHSRLLVRPPSSHLLLPVCLLPAVRSHMQCRIASHSVSLSSPLLPLPSSLSPPPSLLSQIRAILDEPMPTGGFLKSTSAIENEIKNRWGGV